MSKFQRALKKAVATFIFSTGGVMLGSNLLGADWALWKQALSTGIGALLNLVYRWSESAMKEV